MENPPAVEVQTSSDEEEFDTSDIQVQRVATKSPRAAILQPPLRLAEKIPRRKSTSSLNVAPPSKPSSSKEVIGVKRKRTRSLAAAVEEPSPKLPRLSLPSVVTRKGGQVSYDDMVGKLYSSNRYVGQVELPITLLAPASLHPEMCTRPLNQAHVQELKVSYKSLSSGLNMRGSSKIVLILKAKATKTQGALTVLLNELRSKTPDVIVSRLIELSRSDVDLLTVGGNHSREAVTDLIKSGASQHFTTSTTVRCDVFHQVGLAEVTALGVVDNIVSSSSQALTLCDKAELIHRLWKNPDNIETVKSGKNKGRRLNDAAMRQAAFGIMHTNDSLDEAKRLKACNPFIKACDVPDVLWELVFQLLEKKVLSQTLFRSIQWTLPPAEVEASLRNLVRHKDAKVFANELLQIKLREKICMAIEAISSTEEYKPLLSDDFFQRFEIHLQISTLISEYKADLVKHTGGGAFSSASLTTRVSSALDRMLGSGQAEGVSKDFTTVKGLDSKGKASVHSFASGDGIQILNVIQQTGSNISMVVIDPPYGVLPEIAWDVQLPSSWWKSFYQAIATSPVSNAPLVVFGSEQMQAEIITAANTWGFSYHKTYHWLKLQHAGSSFGRSSYPCNHVTIFSRTAITYNPVSELANYLNGNFVATIRCPSFKIDNVVLNETQKPIMLMRFFIEVFALPRGAVLDLFSGSGSTAMAAASLGVDSFNVDIRPEQISGSMTRLQREMTQPRTWPSSTNCVDTRALLNFHMKLMAPTPAAKVTSKKKEMRSPRKQPAANPIPSALDSVPEENLLQAPGSLTFEELDIILENADEVLETNLLSETEIAALELQDFNLSSDRSREDAEEQSAESLHTDSTNSAEGDSQSPDSDFVE